MEIGLAYILFIPIPLLTEVVYLVGNPRTFRGLAVVVWFVIVGVSLIFAFSEGTEFLVPFILAGSWGAYYFVKMWGHKRHRLKKRGRRV